MLCHCVLPLLGVFANLLSLSSSQNGIIASPVSTSPESAVTASNSAQPLSLSQMLLMASTSSDALIPLASASSPPISALTGQDVSVSEEVRSSTVDDFRPFEQTTSSSTGFPQILTSDFSSGSTVAITSMSQSSESTTQSSTFPVFKPSTQTNPSTIIESSTQPSPSTIIESSAQPSPSTIIESSAQPSPSTIIESSTQPSPSTIIESSAQPSPSTIIESSAQPSPSTIIESSTLTNHSQVFDSSSHSPVTSAVTSQSASPPTQSRTISLYLIIPLILGLAFIIIIIVSCLLARRKRGHSQAFVLQAGKRKKKTDDTWAGKVTLPEDGESNEAAEDKKDEDLSSKRLSLSTFKRKSMAPTSSVLDVEKGPDLELEVQEPLLSNGLSSGSIVPQDAPSQPNNTVSKNENGVVPVNDLPPPDPPLDTSQGLAPESEAPKTAF
ncbi:uncharacterized protein LOC132813913 [Hemiscyllium ocellatum]|uniref:uncharacterized protein LOC132813913 n=1 Tax=Hemiscyllium ocellatum TaxID=170820 RepID=UPI00296625B8|nr:uncharacterized protein LOC132813913 [Hemiscyllium ocellatum]